MLLLMSMQLLIINYCVTLRLFWGLCWKLYMQGMNKYVQNEETFICDFVDNVKLCQVDLHNMYHNEENKYNYNDFPQFWNFIDDTFEHLHTIWWNNSIVGVQQVAFSYYGKIVQHSQNM